MAPRSPAPRVAIVVNPSKFQRLETVKTSVGEFARSVGWARPSWIETTPRDPGESAARKALAKKPDLVCAMGGDGTVRAVAGVLRGTGVRYGLLPAGTGNLLARNLGLPLESLTEALEIALLGQTVPIDVGLATFDDGLERPFVVMGGVGLDAQIMSKTDEDLKKKIGWAAYVAAAGPTMFGERFRARVSVDGTGHDIKKALMVLACNCSSVIANIDVAAGAVLDDGILDLVALQPNRVAGLAGVALDVAAGKRNGAASLKQWAGKKFDFTLDAPVLAELDGDPVGETTSGRFRVDKGALLVRLPVPLAAGARLSRLTG